MKLLGRVVGLAGVGILMLTATAAAADPAADSRLISRARTPRAPLRRRSYGGCRHVRVGPPDRIDAGSLHNTREWGDWYYLYGCRVLDTREWGEWRHLYGFRVLAMVEVMVRNFRPRRDDRAFWTERDGLHFL